MYKYPIFYIIKLTIMLNIGFIISKILKYIDMHQLNDVNLENYFNSFIELMPLYER